MGDLGTSTSASNRFRSSSVGIGGGTGNVGLSGDLHAGGNVTIGDPQAIQSMERLSEQTLATLSSAHIADLQTQQAITTAALAGQQANAAALTSSASPGGGGLSLTSLILIGVGSLVVLFLLLRR